MIRLLEQMLDRRSTVYLACAATLAIGLFFIFVRAPHPWGTEGFDHYHELALTIAAGRPFPTMEVPWGYAYFLAAFYRLFGNHPPIPLAAQALLNAAMPLLVFRLAHTWFDRQTAALAAVLTGLFSFNTVYASTQSSDAVCTVMFTTAVLAFVHALDSGRLPSFALAGALMGVATQFRPNLILTPLLLAAFGFAIRRSVRVPVAIVLCATAALTPWIVRNYRLTRMFVPASVHGGVQLWYGSLQVGPYMNSRAYNPRAVYESGVFDYTSLDDVPLVVTAHVPECAPGLPVHVSMTYWTSRDPAPRTVAARLDGRDLRFEAPAPSSPAAFYYFVSADWPGVEPYQRSIPPGGRATPAVFFISQDHFGDLDLNRDLLDIFDLIRAMRHAAWGEATPDARANLQGAPALEVIAGRLAQRFESRDPTSGSLVMRLVHDDREAVLTLSDGSTITVPRRWRGQITDVGLRGPLATALMSSSVPAIPADAATARAADSCVGLDRVEVNRVFYRREPHLMRRYNALALDNIRRDPGAFAVAAAFRAARMFVVWGSGDRSTTQQFEGGRSLSAIATLFSAIFAVLFVAGAIVSWRRRQSVLLPLLLILYVPATIAPMLTNMRYTITIQPLMFMFIAAGLAALLDRRGVAAMPLTRYDRAGTRRVHQP